MSLIRSIQIFCISILTRKVASETVSRHRWFMLRSGIALIIFLGFPTISHAICVQPSALSALFGNRDGAILVDSKDQIIFSYNGDKKRIPASTLKILTALVALHHLGPDYRFVTEFYRDRESNLKIKGYGDPLLISEVLAEMAEALSPYLLSDSNSIQSMILDDSYFTHPLTIPGVTSSSEPYDAPNGAFCVNFNTVNFARDEKGNYISAEPQTPLLPFVRSRITATGLDSGRIMFSNNGKEATLYAGHLMAFFLGETGIHLKGSITTGTVEKEDKLILRYTSKYSLTQVIHKLLEHSNNFVANQILVTTGAKIYGPPGSLTKGVAVASNYAKEVLGIKDITLIEGSGISRKNRMSPSHMIRILNAFLPYHHLMRKTGRVFYKTGTLKGIHTCAGYMENNSGGLNRFVIFLNTPGKSIEKIMDRFKELSCQ